MDIPKTIKLYLSKTNLFFSLKLCKRKKLVLTTFNMDNINKKSKTLFKISIIILYYAATSVFFSSETSILIS